MTADAAVPAPQTSAPASAATQAADAGTQAADAVELLGLVAQVAHTEFVRLAADSQAAPSIEQRLALSRCAAECVQGRDRVLDRIAELGGDPVAAMARHEHVMDDFDARTAPGSWWERLLTAYVGYGVADDFCRLAAEGLDERSRTLVLEVLGAGSPAELAAAELDAASAQDTVLAARLALWGRRLVGESLSVVQRLLAQRPALERLLHAARSGHGPESAEAEPTTTNARPRAGESAAVLGELTAEHTRRMNRLRLTA
ncbi:ferritin-like fold-containing protein [Cellulomonas sp. NTE-D12]|uniref:ferritin-like fold-containing protein n=1 Tax=Cellulomonas sp. NTE-D12 TaxID=2962632 RepID=UPI0030817C60|nr:hydroxylase [Cellulomonas sp. NTE-D12]